MLRLGFHRSSQCATLARVRSRKASANFRESGFFVTLSIAFLTITKGFLIVCMVSENEGRFDKRQRLSSKHCQRRDEDRCQ